MKRDSHNPQDSTFVEDPHFDALLDEALSVDSIPGGLPDGLSDRVFAATVSRLPSGAGIPAHTEVERDVVGRIGRIGFAGVLKRVAAVIVAAGAIAAVIIATQGPAPTPPTGGDPVAKAPTADAPLEEIIGAESEAEYAWDSEEMPLDVAIEELSMALDRPLDGSADEWTQMRDSLEAELDAMGLDDI